MAAWVWTNWLLLFKDCCFFIVFHAQSALLSSVFYKNNTIFFPYPTCSCAFMKVCTSPSSAALISVVVVPNFVISSVLRSITYKKTPYIQITKKAIQSNASRWLCVRATWRICHFSSNLVLMFVPLRSKCSAVHDQRLAVFEEQPRRCLVFVCRDSLFLCFTICQISRVQMEIFRVVFWQINATGLNVICICMMDYSGGNLCFLIDKPWKWRWYLDLN